MVTTATAPFFAAALRASGIFAVLPERIRRAASAAAASGGLLRRQLGRQARYHDNRSLHIETFKGIDVALHNAVTIPREDQVSGGFERFERRRPAATGGRGPVPAVYEFNRL